MSRTPGKRKPPASPPPPTPRKGKGSTPLASAAALPRRSPPRMEFRSPADGAWYAARVAVQGGALRVMYEEFLEEQDEWYDAARLASPRDVAALRASLRRGSRPLDDARCRDLRPGAALCVSCPLGDDELKFFDAVLESVSPAAHGTVGGEERCACRFTVRWAEGPLAGGAEEVGVERVCCVQTSPVQDQVLAEFLDGVAKRLGDDKGNESSPQTTGASAVAEGGGSGDADAPPGFRSTYGEGCSKQQVS
ncbi:hypothetical protein ACP4OV_027135 [Aristida adscensionis]